MCATRPQEDGDTLVVVDEATFSLDNFGAGRPMHVRHNAAAALIELCSAPSKYAAPAPALHTESAGRFPSFCKREASLGRPARARDPRRRPRRTAAASGNRL